MTIRDLQTPALVVDAAALEHNLRTMAAGLPGPRLRLHVQAHKWPARVDPTVAYYERVWLLDGETVLDDTG